ncbi:inactive dipeptidyl peptidase 10 isoform X2 [Lingula anatina]|uniref:Inactive dipeptidyl peptidase 10 isoform X2 n=1 Tax=Lingula anatina TaxID=7574 RepID=A0A1S3HJB1_LINAN|nr:inactive dipeptidyl peptidase 10 isoform X2 [Lingula anatina]|eukprot:XP_013386097.1 inactive dipeptidyl peptidase 10 isoform X2 [Lingula anatina]
MDFDSESGSEVEYRSSSNGKKKSERVHTNPSQPDDAKTCLPVRCKELVGSNPTQRNWKGIILALLVIAIILGLIVLAVILVMPKDEYVPLGEKFSLQDIFDPDYQPKKHYVQWLGDRDIYAYRDGYGNLRKHEAANNRSFMLLENTTFRRLGAEIFYVSEDLQYVLLAYNVKRQFRHSFLGQYMIYSTRDPSKSYKLEPVGHPDARLQYAGWSPNGHLISYVYNNNLYYVSDPENVVSTTRQLTHDGAPNLIYNGIPDWLYEEEILRSNKAHWWSPGGTYIVYAAINDSNVPVYHYPVFGGGSNLYGDINGIPYPKAGDLNSNNNPTFKLKAIELSTQKTEELIPPPHPAFKDKQYYFTTVSWRDNVRVMVSWMNRAQNFTSLTVCYTYSGNCSVNLNEEVKQGKGWVDIYTPPLFSASGDRYFLILPDRYSTDSYFRNVAEVAAPIRQKGEKRFLTSTEWDATEILAYDDRQKLIYFLGTGGDSRKRHLYRVGGIDSKSARKLECLSCDMGDQCLYVSAQFSRTGNYYVLQCLGPGVPTYWLKSASDPKYSQCLESNQAFKTRMSVKATPRIEYLEIGVKDEKTDKIQHRMWARVELPPRLKKSEVIKYPILIDVYGGPGGQKATYQYNVGWSTYMTSSKDVIYAYIDGRGSGNRGDKYLHSIYKQLGTVEVADQVTGARALVNDLSYIDEFKVSIWGWSYGGFVSAHALAEGTDVFQCGIAVAPVTDWRYYDTIYSERYMGRPTDADNIIGYQRANLSAKANKFRKVSLFLIHGTADENVHFQNTAQFAKALTEAGADFRTQFYTDETHSLRDPDAKIHLYKTMADYLWDCYNGTTVHGMAIRKVAPPEPEVE